MTDAYETFIVQYESKRYVSYEVQARNSEEAKVVADNLRMRNESYLNDDDFRHDSIVTFFRTIKK